MKFEYIRSIVLVFILLFGSFQGIAQTVQRESVASGGSSNSIDGVLIRHTVGQPYATVSYYTNDLGYRPGFQQLSNSKMEITKSAIELSLNVYPNPAAKYVTIESYETMDHAFIQVTDMSGRITLHENVAGLRKHVIKCDEWPDGIYFITLYDNHRNLFSSKLIKN